MRRVVREVSSPQAPTESAGEVTAAPSSDMQRARGDVVDGLERAAAAAALARAESEQHLARTTSQLEALAEPHRRDVIASRKGQAEIERLDAALARAKDDEARRRLQRELEVATEALFKSSASATESAQKIGALRLQLEIEQQAVRDAVESHERAVAEAAAARAALAAAAEAERAEAERRLELEAVSVGAFERDTAAAFADALAAANQLRTALRTIGETFDAANARAKRIGVPHLDQIHLARGFLIEVLERDPAVIGDLQARLHDVRNMFSPGEKGASVSLPWLFSGPANAFFEQLRSATAPDQRAKPLAELHCYLAHRTSTEALAAVQDAQYRAGHTSEITRRRRAGLPPPVGCVEPLEPTPARGPAPGVQVVNLSRSTGVHLSEMRALSNDDEVEVDDQ